MLRNRTCFNNYEIKQIQFDQSYVIYFDIRVSRNKIEKSTGFIQWCENV